MFNILVAEDNTDMRELFCTVLSDNGYRTFSASDGPEALELMDREYIDLIVADIMELPVLIVTAKEQFDDMQKGFHIGADDYMVKPVNVKELVLRVEALLRRAKIQSEKRIVVGDTVLDYDALTVTLHGSETDERTVNTHINRLRERFADCKDFEIITMRGLGYKAVKRVE